MQVRKLLWLLPTAFSIVNANPTDDMRSLLSSCNDAADVLNASLNSTIALDTSGMIQNLTWQVGASKANLEGDNTTTTISNTTGQYDSPYFDYVDAIITLSEALVRRGRIFHQEMNSPVYLALRGLETGVQAYGLQLRNAGLISQNATIRTFTAGSSIVEAESLWANTANYPGPKRRSNRIRYN